MAQTHYFPEDKVYHVWDDKLDPSSPLPPATRWSTTPAM
jgi:hypothetical protein